MMTSCSRSHQRTAGMPERFWLVSGLLLLPLLNLHRRALLIYMTDEHSYVEVQTTQLLDDERHFSWVWLGACAFILLTAALALYLFFGVLLPKATAQ